MNAGILKDPADLVVQLLVQGDDLLLVLAPLLAGDVRLLPPSLGGLGEVVDDRGVVALLNAAGGLLFRLWHGLTCPPDQRRHRVNLTCTVLLPDMVSR